MRNADANACTRHGPSRTYKPHLQATSALPLATVSVWSRHYAHLTGLNVANVSFRGSAFLNQWMEYLEENADLRYPNLTEVYVDDQ